MPQLLCYTGLPPVFLQRTEIHGAATRKSKWVTCSLAPRAKSIVASDQVLISTKLSSSKMATWHDVVMKICIGSSIQKRAVLAAVTASGRYAQDHFDLAGGRGYSRVLAYPRGGYTRNIGFSLRAALAYLTAYRLRFRRFKFGSVFGTSQPYFRAAALICQ